jgi:hypothetical protein
MSTGPSSSPAGSAAFVAGDYVLDNDSVGATLSIVSVSADSVVYDLTVVGKTGSNHNGELDTQTAKRGSVSTSLFVDKVGSDCEIHLQPTAGGAISLVQVGSCSDAGFGAYLDASGTYTKKTTGATGPNPSNIPIAAGKYINSDIGAMLMIYGPCSTQNSLSDRAGSTVLQGTLGADQHTLPSPEGNVCGNYALTQAKPGVIMVTWSPDPTAHLGDLASGCKSIEGEYDMTEPGTLEVCSK